MGNKHKKITSTQSIYCYPNSETLINKLNIVDKKLLEDIDRTYSTYKLSKMYLRKFTGNFDVDHYLDIHKYIFGDLYGFAGSIRNENISKSGITFCRPKFINKYLRLTLLNMKFDVEKIHNEEQLLDFLAHYYGELDIIHPFREGNGRVQREFFRQYMNYINENTILKNYTIEYSRWTSEDKQILIDGCIISAKTGSTHVLRHVLSKSLISEKSMSKGNIR